MIIKKKYLASLLSGLNASPLDPLSSLWKYLAPPLPVLDPLHTNYIENTDFQTALNNWVKNPLEPTSISYKLEAQSRILNCYRHKSKPTILNLRQLNLYSIPPLFGLTHIEIIDLEDNNITHCEKHAFSHLKNLKILHLSNNKLTSIARLNLKHCPHLKQLNLFKNKLKDSGELAQISTLSELEILDLSSNQFKKIKNCHFYKLNNLQSLNLSNNQIQELKLNLSTSTHLIRLDLSRNQLTSVNGLNLEKCIRLQKLELWLNQIENIDRLVLVHCSELNELNLSNNQLTTFNCILPTIKNPNLIVYLQKNKFSKKYLTKLKKQQKKRYYISPTLALHPTTTILPIKKPL